VYVKRKGSIQVPGWALKVFQRFKTSTSWSVQKAIVDTHPTLVQMRELQIEWEVQLGFGGSTNMEKLKLWTERHDHLLHCAGWWY
jgi:hypothetical protein